MKPYLNPLFACCVLALALGNEVVVARFLVHDGELGEFSKSVVRLADIVFIAGAFSSPWIWPFAAGRSLAAFRRSPNLSAAILGLALLLVSLLVIELGFHTYVVVRDRLNPEPVLVRSVPSSQLRSPGTVVREQRLNGDEVIYDYVYTLDDKSARVTPASPNVPMDNELVFFGCSFTFGTGVNDDQTLPNRVALRATGWGVTNFGVGGFGPAHMLRAIESGGVTDYFKGRRTHVIFVYIPDHVRRVVGGMRTSTRFGDNFPFYAIAADGTLEYRGTMTDGRPWLQRFYKVIDHEAVLKAFEIDIPIWITDRHLDLTSRVIVASRDKWGDVLGDSKFTVVIYPEPLWAEFSAEDILPFLKARGVHVLDYSSRFDGRDRMWIPGDYHPTAEAHDQVAEWIVEDLNLVDHDTEQ